MTDAEYLEQLAEQVGQRKVAIPCDLALAPSTVMRAGVDLSFVLRALALRAAHPSPDNARLGWRIDPAMLNVGGGNAE